MDEPILCFKHCNSVIFCFNLPEKCPLCQQSLLSVSLDDIPFRLPNPFVRAKHQPCSIIMKSTDGTFLEHYNCDKNLHIGITDSKGNVHEFDSLGLQTDKTEEWAQSLVAYKSSEVWASHWDDTLAVLHSDSKWHPENYNEIDFNCFTFVIEFLRILKCSELNEYIDKEMFCEEFICPKISSCNNYIKRYRDIKKCGFSL